MPTTALSPDANKWMQNLAGLNPQQQQAWQLVQDVIQGKPVSFGLNPTNYGRILDIATSYYNNNQNADLNNFINTYVNPALNGASSDMRQQAMQWMANYQGKQGWTPESLANLQGMLPASQGWGTSIMNAALQKALNDSYGQQGYAPIAQVAANYLKQAYGTDAAPQWGMVEAMAPVMQTLWEQNPQRNLAEKLPSYMAGLRNPADVIGALPAWAPLSVQDVATGFADAALRRQGATLAPQSMSAAPMVDVLALLGKQTAERVADTGTKIAPEAASLTLDNKLKRYFGDNIKLGATLAALDAPAPGATSDGSGGGVTKAQDKTVLKTVLKTREQNLKPDEQKDFNNFKEWVRQTYIIPGRKPSDVKAEGWGPNGDKAAWASVKRMYGGDVPASVMVGWIDAMIQNGNDWTLWD